MTDLVFANGRPVDALDCVRYRVLARELLQAHTTYSVVSEDGLPITGEWVEGTPKHVFTAIGVQNESTLR